MDSSFSVCIPVCIVWYCIFATAYIKAHAIREQKKTVINPHIDKAQHCWNAMAWVHAFHYGLNILLFLAFKIDLSISWECDIIVWRQNPKSTSKNNCAMLYWMCLYRTLLYNCPYHVYTYIFDRTIGQYRSTIQLAAFTAYQLKAMGN